jgi:hypothetical protein
MRRFYWYAHGSAAEVGGTLELAEAWGWAVDTAQPLRILDRLIALLWGSRTIGLQHTMGHQRVGDSVGA